MRRKSPSRRGREVALTAKRERRRRLLVAGLATAAVCLGALGGWWGRSELASIVAGLPPTPSIATLPVSVEVLDRNGQMLRPFTTDGRWRLPVTPDQVDQNFLKMLFAYEDRHFYEHGGLDWTSMARAAGQFVLAGGHIVSGGSTLTMQVARLIEGDSTHNAYAKLRQILHARLLEQRLSKTDILTLYLTLAPYGGNIEGIRAASLAWFGKEPTRLTTAEAALLVALPQSPEARRPDLHPQAARAARDMVLDRLAGEGVITADDAATAKRDPMPKARRDFPMLAAHLTQVALTARPDAREIRLSIDSRLQASLEDLAHARAGQIGPKATVAILAVDEATGDVLASVGSGDLFDADRHGFVDMTTAVRSPGSTLKPLIYGLAFELGLAHPESLIEDRPTAFGSYIPGNFDGETRGTVTVRQALEQSLNIPAMVVLDAVGPARLVDRMNRAGATPVLPKDATPGLAMGLGGAGVTLRQLVSLYAAIARGGTPVRLNDGISPPIPAGGAPAPVLDPVSAWYVSDILSGVAPPTNGSFGRIAFKTGTSFGYRDGWSVGYDGRTVIGVWVGRPDGAPVPGLSGIGSAAPILFEAFDRLGGKAIPLRAPPAGVLVATNAQLPGPLRRFRNPDAQKVAADPAPQIAYPGDGVDVDLGLAGGSGEKLVVKVRNGAPPFTFLANGAPFGRQDFARQDSWTPDGPGFVRLSVVDAEGRSASVGVYLQ